MKKLLFTNRLFSLLLRTPFALTLALVVSLLFSGFQNTLAAGEFTATKTDSLFNDVNRNSLVNTGDTLQYTVTITNVSGLTQTGVGFADTIDSNTTLVAGSVRTTPIARNDSGYSTVGNVLLTVTAGSGVLVNDNDPDGTGSVSVSACGGDNTAPFVCASTNGGNVTLFADGSFTYNPFPGFSGSDTFTYTIKDSDNATDTATVSITVGTPVWFINNTAAAPGDGRSGSPFSSIINFKFIADDETGDYIFVDTGSGIYSDISLKNGQKLIGKGDGLSISPNLSIAAGTRPTILNVVLASGNTVRGLNITTNTGTAISGANVGALTINNVSVNNTGGLGVSLSGGSAMAVTFDSVSSSGGVNGIVLTNNSGSFTSYGGTIDPTTGHGISVSNTGVGPLNFTLVGSTITGTPAGFDGINFNIPSSGSFGTITIQNNTISNNSGAGINADIQGTGTITTKIDVAYNTFTNNLFGVVLNASDTANIKFDIHNNNTMNGTDAQVLVRATDSLPNNGAGPTMEGYIRSNTITVNPTIPNTNGIEVISDGDGNITTDINNNTVSNFGDTGIVVQSIGGQGDVNARIANNTISTTSTASYTGIWMALGDYTPGETNLLCVNLVNNNTSGGSNSLADYVLDRLATATTFQIQGVSPSPATAAQAQTYVIGTDINPPATAVAFPGSYLNTTCLLVPFTSLPNQPELASELDQTPAAAADQAQSWQDAFTSLRNSASNWTRNLIASIGISSAHASGETVNVSLGNMDPSQAVTITFRVTVDNSTTATQISNQGTVTSASASSLQTDDPDLGGASDATITPLQDLTPPNTSLLTNPSNPSNDPTADFTFSGTDNVTPSGSLTFECSMDGASFSACVTPYASPALTDGSHTFQVRAKDAAGNVDATPASYTWVIDASKPGVTLTHGGSNPTSASPITVIATFTEPVTGFGDSTLDTTLVSTAGSVSATVTEITPNDGTTYKIAISGMTSSGQVTVSIPDSAASDTAGNGNNPTSSALVTDFIFDNTAPSVTVEQEAGQLDPTGSDPILFTVKFNETIDTATFTAADITLVSTAGAVSASITEVAPNDGTTFEIQVTGMSTSGTVAASIDANTVKDLGGNDNTASTSSDNIVTFDAVSPGITSLSLQATYSITGPSTFMVYFSEEVNNPVGDSDTDDVTNPANYLIIEKGVNGVTNTTSCAGGVDGDDVKVSVSSVDYFTPPPIAKVNLAAPLPVGSYRLFICGTTSIVDLALTPLGGFPGTDYTFDFVVTASATTSENPEESETKVNVSSLPKTGFAPNKITTLPAQSPKLDYAKLGGIVLEIPSLNVKSTIVGVPEANGEWDVTWLGNNVGWLNGTAFPTWIGNSVLTAHVTNASGLDGPFVALKSLRYGDQIIVHMGGAQYVYEVRNTRLSRPYLTNFAFESKEDASYLTLITCQGYNPLNDSYLFRRVVRAVLVEVK